VLLPAKYPGKDLITTGGLFLQAIPVRLLNIDGFSCQSHGTDRHMNKGSLSISAETLACSLPVEALIRATANRRHPAILDSADTGPGRGRYTILACEPVEVIEWPLYGDDPFQSMQERLRETAAFPGSQDPMPQLGFAGGWIGYFAYEAGRYIENLPDTVEHDLHLPVARFALYDSAAVHDALTGQWTLMAMDHPALPNKRQSVDRRFQKWKRIFATAEERPLLAPPEPVEPLHNMTLDQYLHMVRQAREYIAAGDIFQVNLARRESYPVQEPPLETYLRLRQTNPGAYAAYLAWGENYNSAILSASPELFLHLQGRKVLTRPIKGTRPRTNDPRIDAAYRQALAESEKDRAELAMIVDLERNDIGRVCEFGSVRVICPDRSPAKPYVLEAHPTVYHLVADVTGRLREGVDAIDLLRACFPGGSITGAPKVRAMEIIDELEPTERGVYTGAIGYFGLDGSMMMNIPIRIMIASADQLHLYAGGGIVADSVPKDEYTETQAKALGLCRTLGMHTQSPVQNHCE